VLDDGAVEGSEPVAGHLERGQRGRDAAGTGQRDPTVVLDDRAQVGAVALGEPGGPVQQLQGVVRPRRGDQVSQVVQCLGGHQAIAARIVEHLTQQGLGEAEVTGLSGEHRHPEPHRRGHRGQAGRPAQVGPGSLHLTQLEPDHRPHDQRPRGLRHGPELLRALHGPGDLDLCCGMVVGFTQRPRQFGARHAFSKQVTRDATGVGQPPGGPDRGRRLMLQPGSHLFGLYQQGRIVLCHLGTYTDHGAPSAEPPPRRTS
jgi:hypothetical protein